MSGGCPDCAIWEVVAIPSASADLRSREIRAPERFEEGERLGGARRWRTVPDDAGRAGERREGDLPPPERQKRIGEFGAVVCHRETYVELLGESPRGPQR